MRRRPLTLLFGLSVVFAVVLGASAGSALAANTISGKVFDETTGKTVKGAEACLERTVDVPIACVTSAADGSYELKPATNQTDYVVRFSDAGNYVTSWYQDELTFANATLIDTTGGSETGLIQDLRETPRGSISGRVTTRKTGAPVPSIRVCAVVAAQYEIVECAQTAADGTYSIGGLETGSYKVAFNEPLPETFNSAYISQFWQGATTFAGATPITLTAPAARGGIDAQLQVPGETSEPSPPSTGGTGLTPTPVSTPPTATTPAPLVCKKGFRKEKVKGALRCVRKPKKKHHRRRHPHHAAAGHASNLSVGLLRLPF